MEHAKAIPDLVVSRHREGKTSGPEAGPKRRVLAYNEKLFLAEHEMAKGWVGTARCHVHDQIVYVVRGHLNVSAREPRLNFGPETRSRCGAELTSERSGQGHQASRPIHTGIRREAPGPGRRSQIAPAESDHTRCIPASLRQVIQSPTKMVDVTDDFAAIQGSWRITGLALDGSGSD